MTDWSRKGVGDPLCDGAPIPALVLRRWLAQHHQQRILLRYGQWPPAGPYPVPLILDPVRSALVVTPGDSADPVGRVPSNASNRFGRQPTRQEPEEVPAAPLD